MNKEELRKQVRGRLKLDPALRNRPEIEIDRAMSDVLDKLHDNFRFDGNSVLWLDRQVRLRLLKPAVKASKPA